MNSASSASLKDSDGPMGLDGHSDGYSTTSILQQVGAQKHEIKRQVLGGHLA